MNIDIDIYIYIYIISVRKDKDEYIWDVIMESFHCNRISFHSNGACVSANVDCDDLQHMVDHVNHLGVCAWILHYRMEKALQHRYFGSLSLITRISQNMRNM